MNTRRTLRGAIDALLANAEHPEEAAMDRTLAQSILGTVETETIAARVEAYVREAFGCGVRDCFFFIQSVGAVWGLTLEDGARVVLKAHPLGGGPHWRGFDSLAQLGAVYEVQARMAELGVPCAEVLRAPRAWTGRRVRAERGSVHTRGAIAAMSVLPAPRGDDPHEPIVRRAMATMLAESVELGRQLRLADVAHLPRSTLPEGSVLPPPHNALFRFDAPGGEWIDARAQEARATLDAARERPVAMHTDVSGANVRVLGGRVVAVFDMDSVACVDEMRGLANAAVHFSYRGEPPWTWPRRDEAIAFVDDYVRARGRALEADEKRRLDAAAIYALAYSARCEHSLAEEPDPPMCRALREAPVAYFG